VNFLGDKEDVVFPQFLKCGQELVEMGAEAICLGSTTMHEAHEFLSQKLPVPVINPGPLTYKLAETVLGMGLSHSSKAYPKPSYLKPNLTHAMMDGGAAYDGDD
jgi:allantoin racemase